MNNDVSNDIAVSLRNVIKSYPSYEHVTGGIKSFLFNLGASLKELRSRRLVLNGLSVDVHKGESFAFVGRNGAGKSTLLGLIAGVLAHDSGDVVINGRVSPLLQLGAGFHPELSGRENILLNGILLGLTKEAVLEHMQEIIDFSGLHEFIEQPVRTYSSGMYAKLGFAVVATLEPQILLVDEILAVGDLAFQKKCKDRFARFHSDPEVTTILVSHSLPTVSEVCARAAWIEHKKIKMIGPAKDVVKEYTAANTPKSVVPNSLVQLPPHIVTESIILGCINTRAGTRLFPSWGEGHEAMCYTLTQGGEKVGTWRSASEKFSVFFEEGKLHIEAERMLGNTDELSTEEFDVLPGLPVELHAQGFKDDVSYGEPARILIIHTSEARSAFAKQRGAMLERYASQEAFVAPLWPETQTVRIVSQAMLHGSHSGKQAFSIASYLTRSGLPVRFYAHQSSEDMTGLVSPLASLESAAKPQDIIFCIDTGENQTLSWVASLSSTKVLYTLAGEESADKLQSRFDSEEAKELLASFDKVFCSTGNENVLRAVCEIQDGNLHGISCFSELMDVLAESAG